jgi:hypothetical protein
MPPECLQEDDNVASRNGLTDTNSVAYQDGMVTIVIPLPGAKAAKRRLNRPISPIPVTAGSQPQALDSLI